MANELKFGATIDDSKLLKSLDEIQKRIDGLKDLTINLKMGGGGGDIKNLSADIQKLTNDIQSAEQTLTRYQNSLAHAEQSFQKLDSVVSKAREKFTGGKQSDYADMGGWVSSVGVNVEKQFELLRQQLQRGSKMTEEYAVALRGNLAHVFSDLPLDSSTTKGSLQYLQDIYDKAKAIKDNIKGSDKSLSPSLLDMRNSAKVDMEAAKTLIQMYKELAKAQDDLAKSAKKGGFSDGYDMSYFDSKISQTKRTIRELKEQKAELETAQKSSTTTTPSKDIKVEVTLDHTKFDEQLTALATKITEWQQQHKVVVEASVNQSGTKPMGSLPQDGGGLAPKSTPLPSTADVTLHVKLDEWQNVEPQLLAIKTKIDEWSKTNPIVISTTLGKPDNIAAIKQELGKYDSIWEGVGKQTSGTIPELQKQLGTGDLTQQWKEADAALTQFLKDYAELASKTDASKLAINTGKNTDIYKQLQSVMTLFKEAESGANTIAPEKLATALTNVKTALSGADMTNAASGMKTAINEIQSSLSTMYRVGVEGVSPLENAVLKAETAIAKSVIGIRMAVQEMVDALSKDNLTAFTTRAAAAAAAIQKLAEGVGGFNNVAVNQQGMRDLLTGLGALINNLKEINGGNPIKGADAMLRQYENDIERIRKAILGLNADEEKLRAAMALGNTNGNADARFGTQIQAIEEYRRKLQDFLQTDFSKWNFDDVKKALSADRALLNSETDATLKYAESMRVAQMESNRLQLMIEKYSQTLAELQQRGIDSTGLDGYLQKLRDFQQMFQSLLNSQQIGGVELSKNARYKSVIDNSAITGSDAAQSIKDYDNALKVVNKTVEDLTKSQKDLDAAIANGKQKGADVSGVEAMRTEILSLINAAQQAKSPQDAVASLVGSKQTIDESTQAIRNLNAAIKENEAIEKNRRDAKNQIADLDIKLRKMEAIERQRKALPDDMQGNVTNLAQQYRDILSVRTQLNAVATGVDNTKVSDILAQSDNYTKLKNAISDTTTALQELKQQQMLNRKNQAGRSFQDLSDAIQELDNLKARARNNGYIIDPNLEQNIANARAELVKFRDELEKVMNGTSNKSALSITGQDAYKQAKDNAALQAIVLKEAIDKHKIDTKNVNDAEKEYNALVRTLEQVDKLIASNSALRFPVDLQSLEDAKKAFEKLRDTYNGIANGSDSQNALHFKNQAANVDTLARANLALAEAKVAVNKQQREENKKQGIDPAIKNIEDAIKAYRSLSSEITKLTKTSEEGKKYHFDTTDVDNAIQKLTALRDKIQAIMVGSVAGKTKDITNSQAYIDATSQGLMANNTLAAKNAEEKARLAGQTNKLTEEEQRLAKAIQEANNAGHQQSQILSDLRSMAMQYMSVYYVQQFVKEMANITGELELQKKSLEVILNSASTAQQLYGQIQALSQQSPYTFQDLLKSTRQLAAFGVQTKDLFGTMRALSDIGAGLSVDVNRLILAFGHTRSYGYLSGIQNRQFENAGIDLMGELMKKYNKQAEEDMAAGRQASFVTRKDLFKRMRTRDISFEDVQDVVLGLDKPGGKFYNMQERQFETLGGKLRNLKNNYNIMMSEMGQSNMGLLKGGVDVMNTLTEDWRTYYNLIMDVVVGLGAAKAAQLALGGSSALNSLAAAQKQMTRDNIAKSLLGGGYGLNVGQRINQQGVAYGQAILNTDMSKIEKAKSVMFKSVDKDTREMVLRELGASEKYIAKINNLSSKTGFWWARASLSMKMFAAETKAAMTALITNPMTWIFAVLAAATAIYNKISDANELRDKMLDEAQTAGKQDSDSIDEIFKESNYVKRLTQSSGDVNGVFTVKYGLEFDDEAILKHNPMSVLEEVTKQLQQYSPLYQGQIIDIMAMENDIDKVKAAFESLNKAQYVDKIMAGDNTIAEALAEGPSKWNLGLTDNFIEDLKDDKKAFQDLDDAIRSIISTEKRYAQAVDENVRKSISEEVSTTGDDRKTIMKRKYRQGAYISDAIDTGNGARDDIKKDAEGLAEQFVANFTNYFKGDNESSAIYFQHWLNRMFAEAKISDTAQQLDITNILLEQIGNQGDNGQKFAEYFRGLKLKEHFAAEIKGMIKDNTSAEDAQKIFVSISKKTQEWAMKQGVITGKISKEQGAAYAKMFKQAFDAEMNSSALQTNWQRRGVGMFNVNTTMKNNIKTVIDIDEFAQAVEKNRKELQEYLKRNEGHIKKLALKLGIKLDTKLDAEALKQVISTVRKKAFEKLRKSDLKGAKELWDQASEFQDYLNALQGAEEDKKWQKAEGYPEKDPNKDKKGNQEDKLAKQFREETRLIKEAYDWYVKWEKKIGDSEALKIVNEEYSKLLSESGDALKKLAAGLNLDISGISIENIPKYKESLLQLLTAAEKAYNNPKHKNNYMLEAIRALKSELQQVGFNDFEKNSQKALSAVQNSLEDLTRQWSIFTKVREATGDVDFAKSVAGFNAEDLTGASNIVDLQKQKIRNFMSNTSANSSDIVLDTIWEKSKKDIEELAKKAYEGNNNAENVEGLIEYLSKLKDAERQLQDERANALANALASSELLVDRLQKINDEYERQKNLIDKMPDSPQKNQALSKLKSERDYKSLRETYKYKYAMSAVFTQTESELERLAEELRNTLEESLKNGGISAEQYAEEIEKINNQFDKIRQKRSDVGAFFSNGLNGLFQNLSSKGKELVTQGALKEQEGQGLINAYNNGKGTHEDFIKGVNMKADGSNMIGQGNGMMQMAGKAVSAVSMIDMIVNGINKNVQSLRKFLDTLADTFEKLGKGGDKIKDSGFYGFMSAFSEASQGAADGWNSLKDGDIMGAIDGTFRSFSGWWTGFAQWHDDKRQRQIEKIQLSIDRMNDTIDAIKRNRERTLGYDKGDLNRNYANFYSQAKAMRTFSKMISDEMVDDNNAVFDAMRKFYSDASGAANLNGYQQELNNLMQQRLLLWRQYNLENDKKNEDDGKLQDYISKISELDDQIEYFKDDLLKDLFEIDFSSWADKLSDALISAFENGEDAVEAYDKSVREIIQSVIKNALKLATVEPLFKRLREEVTEAFDIAAPEDSAASISKIITEAFSATGYMTKGLEAYNTALSETEKKLNAIGLSIRDIEGIAESWYSIDVDSWAKDLSSALTDAFYNGKLAAQSYAETVRSVMQQVVNSMLQTAYLEPMMEKLKQQLYGYTDENGVVHSGAFNADNAQGSLADVAGVLASFFGDGGVGKAMLTSSQEFVTAMQQLLKESGLSLMNTTTSNTSNSISSAATEETMGVVSGYLAAIRQDVSVQRIYMTQIASEYMPEFKESLQANRTALSSIDLNVKNIYNAIHNGDGALYSAIESLRSDVHSVVVGNDSFKIR